LREIFAFTFSKGIATFPKNSIFLSYLRRTRLSSMEFLGKVAIPLLKVKAKISTQLMPASRCRTLTHLFSNRPQFRLKTVIKNGMR